MRQIRKSAARSDSAWCVNILRRFVDSELKESLEESPIVLIEGARQVGKSTLAREIAEHRSAHYVTLDDGPTFDLARFDPMSFLEQAPDKMLVVDEAQRLPDLFLPLKATVDRDRRPGRFLFTGSANFLKLPGVGDSLAGRLTSVSLKPFSMGEMDGRSNPEDFVSWLLDIADSKSALPDRLGVDLAELVERVCAGGYPEPFFRKTQRRRHRWFDNYVERLVGHDAAHLGSGNSSKLLESLLRRVATNPSQPLVQAKIARHIGATAHGIKGVLDLASTMFLVEETPAWSSSLSNRDVKTSKLSLLDSGLSASLAGFFPGKELQVGGSEYFGALLEQFVMQQLSAQRSWSLETFDVFHYRTRDGQEIDVVIELRDGRIIMIEVKTTQTPNMSAFTTIRNVRRKLGDRVIAGIVLHTGTHASRMEDWLYQLPVSALWRHSV